MKPKDIFWTETAQKSARKFKKHDGPAFDCIRDLIDFICEKPVSGYSLSEMAASDSKRDQALADQLTGLGFPENARVVSGTLNDGTKRIPIGPPNCAVMIQLPESKHAGFSHSVFFVAVQLRDGSLFY